MSDAEAETNALDEAYLMAKLVPAETGLRMAVSITPDEGFHHDVRVKVSRIAGRRGRWHDAAPVAVRPQPRLVVPGSLPPADLAVVSRWIELNRAVIIDYWDGRLTTTEALPRLRRLP
jgi:hypothetical protein